MQSTIEDGVAVERVLALRRSPAQRYVRPVENLVAEALDPGQSRRSTTDSAKTLPITRRVS